MADRVPPRPGEQWGASATNPFGQRINVVADTPQRSRTVPDEWQLSVALMEAGRRIGIEVPVGQSWRSFAMLTNAILAELLGLGSDDR